MAPIKVTVETQVGHSTTEFGIEYVTHEQKGHAKTKRQALIVNQIGF